MAFLDGPAQIILLIVVFCCPIIPAGGWCWLKCIECCLKCLQNVVANVRKYAYVPMYLCLLALLVAGCMTVVPDWGPSEQTANQTYAFNMFVVTSVLALLTIIVSVHSTLKVLQGQVSIDEQRERTVYIIALPSFYCLMCFLSSQQLLIKSLGTVAQHWAWDMTFTSEHQEEEFTLDMVTFYLSAADVFESFAFTFFGTMTMEAMRRASELATMRQGHERAREAALQSCIQKWTMSPIYSFCFVLCIQSMYNLISVFGKYFHLGDLLPPALYKEIHGLPQPDQGVVDTVFFTLTSIFSSLAIMALFSIEHVFHDDLASVDFVLDCERMKSLKFLSNLKFWGVKLFVTIEFTLECIMFVLKRTSLNEIQKQLIYTTCMASMCFAIALLHVWAYAPHGRWIVAEDLLLEGVSVRDIESTLSPSSDMDVCPSPGGISLPTVERAHSAASSVVSFTPASAASQKLLEEPADDVVALVSAPRRDSEGTSKHDEPATGSSIANEPANAAPAAPSRLFPFQRSKKVDSADHSAGPEDGGLPPSCPSYDSLTRTM